MVSDRIDQEDYRRGFILDGFPRTVAQAEALTAMLEQKGIKLDAVIDLKVDQAALIARMERRVADKLSAGGTVRSDDNPDTFASRTDEYRLTTAQLLNYYRRRGALTAWKRVVEGKSVSVGVDNGGSRIIKQNSVSTIVGQSRV